MKWKLLLTFVTFAVYANGLKGEFIYDDRPIILENPLIRSLPRSLHLFTTAYWGSDIGRPQPLKGSLYRPLTGISYALNYAVVGAKPLLFKFTNVLLHLLFVFLLFALARRWGWSELQAFWTALFFAVLPIHVEAVTNIVGRAEILASIFVVSGWLLLFQEKDKRRQAIGLLCYALALLSKETGASMLPILVLSELWISKDRKGVAKERWPLWLSLFGVLAIYLSAKKLVLGQALATGGSDYFASTADGLRVLTMGKFFLLHYLKPLVSGTGLMADFSRPAFPDAALHDVFAWAGLCLWFGAFATSGYFAFAKQSKPAWAGFIFFGLLMPMSNLILPLEVVGAERFLYLPSIGFCLAAGYFFGKSKGGWTLAVALSLLWSVQTIARNRTWLTPRHFWETLAKDSPRNPRAWNGFGMVQMQEKRFPEARAMFQKALQLDPFLVDAQYNLAELLFFEGNLKEAEAAFIAFLQNHPWEKDSLLYLAVIADQQKDWPKAIWYYGTVLKLDPFNLTARRNRGLVFCRQKRIAECREDLEEYLRIAPREEPTAGIRQFLLNVPSSKGI